MRKVAAREWVPSREARVHAKVVLRTLRQVVSKREVRDALSKMVEGRTSVIIAHRLSTIQQADKILVMHKGRLREQGTHQELLAMRGIYWKLYQLQYKDQALGAANQETQALR